MTKALYRESSGESYSGMEAVAQVILNRKNNPKFPNTICKVIYQKNRNTYQFSWTKNDKSTYSSYELWNKCKKISIDFILNGKKYDKLNNPNFVFFHSKNLPFKWKYKIVAVVGNHIFYDAS